MKMRQVIAAWTLAIMAAGPVLAVDGGETSSGAFPYIGVLTGTNVYVRCGPGESDGRSSYYPCAKLSAPERVTVTGQRNGWLEILAPPGTFCVIYSQYVEVDESGEAGTVTGDNVRVRAGGEEHQSNFWQPLTQLNSGDQVRVTGEVTDRFGKWYKIRPPEDARFWIYGKYVRRAGAPPEAEETQAPATVTRPVAGEPVATMTSEDSDALLARIKELEAELRREYEKPRGQRNFQQLLEKYERIDVPEDSFARPWLDSRIQFLRNAIRQREELEEVETILERTEAQREQLRMERLRRQLAEQPARTRKPYQAEGVLMESELFTGGPLTPKRYLLRDPATFQIRAYVQCTSGDLDLKRFTGMYVGVAGARHYEERLAVEVIDARSVVVLKTNAEARMPAEPTVVRPQPPAERSPAPRPEVPAVQPPAEPQPPGREPSRPLAQEPVEEALPAPEELPTEPREPEEQPTERREVEAPPAPVRPPVEEPREPAPPVIAPGPAPRPRPPAREEELIPEPLELEPQPQEPEAPERRPTIIEILPPVETEPAPAPPPAVPSEPEELPAQPTRPAPATQPARPRTQPETAPPPRTSPAETPPVEEAPSPEATEPPAPGPSTRPVNPMTLRDPLPPTGLPMVKPDDNALSAQFDEREYE